MTNGRDRLRELLDAVLDENNATLDRMAQHVYASPSHFSRTFAVGTGEPPVALRRRVILERAAWQLRTGMSVTDAAFTAGYDSVEGFCRAFHRAYGYPPSATARVLGTAGGAHWLPAPNGVHFHPPVNLWISDGEQRTAASSSTAATVSEQLIRHDLDDTRVLLDHAGTLDAAEYTRIRFPGLVVLDWDGLEESVAAVLGATVWAKEVWLASMAGADHPKRGDDDVDSLRARFDDVAPKWIEAIRDIDRRGAWEDRLVDALCEPPESFVLGGVIAHVLTFSAHRRQLARHMLRAAGVAVDNGDPLDWRREAVPPVLACEPERKHR